MAYCLWRVDGDLWRKTEGKGQVYLLCCERGAGSFSQQEEWCVLTPWENLWVFKKWKTEVAALKGSSEDWAVLHLQTSGPVRPGVKEGDWPGCSSYTLHLQGSPRHGNLCPPLLSAPAAFQLQRPTCHSSETGGVPPPFLVALQGWRVSFSPSLVPKRPLVLRFVLFLTHSPSLGIQAERD